MSSTKPQSDEKETDLVKVVDKDGFTINLAIYDGVYFPAFPGLKERLDELKTFKGRDDDIAILAYPKCGTHWVWNITQMLAKQTTAHVTGEKMQEFIEYVDQVKLDAVSSPRILNTHLRPKHLPPDIVRRKCRTIYVQRNPKDVFVSFFNHVKNIPKGYGYEGNFSGFFELMLTGEIESGSWFDYTLDYEKFFADHPDFPVLRLHYEDMKRDLLSSVKRIAEFCGFSVTEETLKGITDACTFSSLKNVKVAQYPEERLGMWRDGQYRLYRKGVTGDWKNYFTVAQNERFEAECQRRLEGSGVEIRWAN